MLIDGLKDRLTAELNPTGGVNKDTLPRGYVFPAIVIHKYNGALEYDFSGPVGVEDVNVQLDIYGKTPDERDTLSKSLTDFLDAFTGTLEDGSVVQACFRERGPQDLPFVPNADQKGPGYRTLVGYRVVIDRS
jgi:hypothetical protein